MSSAAELPRGTVTFLFTDIEGSTRLLKQLRDHYEKALDEHQRILRKAFDEHGGREIDTQGDSFFVAFPRAKDAVAAAVEAQRALAEQTWPEGAELRVRMGLHTGEPTVGEERYVGIGVHRGARISAAGHGGQVLVSQTTRELLRDDPLPDVSLRDLGEHHLKDLDEPERIYQLVAPGLAEEFPPLKATASTPFAGREVELVEAAEDVVQDLAASWRPGRRLLSAALVLTAAVGVVVGLLLTRGGVNSASASGEVAANAVGLIDAKSGKIAAQIPVGAGPSGVASADSSIWITNADGNTVSRIDAKTNAVRQTIQVGEGPTGVAISGDAVWVANGLDGTVSRIDQGTDQVVDKVVVGNGPTGVAYGVAYGHKSVWVANSVDGTVSQIDPETGHMTRTIAATVGAAGVAVGFNRVWVVSPSSASLVVLDPRTGEVEGRIGVGVDAAAVAAGAGAVWVANRADGTVSKIDPRTRGVVDTIRVGRSPSAIAVGPGGVWVANTDDGTLSRIDPASDEIVKTVSVKNTPQGLAVTPDGVFVAVRSTGREHRGGKLVVLYGSPGSVDPALTQPPSGWSILAMTNDGLVGFRRVGGVEGVELVPDLAVSLPTPGDDGKTYTFRVRPNVHYSNGKLVQPADFRRAIERLFELRPTPYVAQWYSGVDGAARCKPGRRCDLSRGIATDRLARTVTFHLAAAEADFLTKLAMPSAFAVPADTPDHDVGSHPVPATGPYMIASYRANGSAKLVRNPRFREWSADAQPDGYPDVISLRAVDAAAVDAQVRAIERRTADVAISLVPPLSKNQLDRLATRYPSQLHMSAAAATTYFFLNTRVPPFDDVRVRRAVNYAFDRQEFAQLLGRAFAPTCQILPPNFPSYRRSCQYLPGGVASLDLARRLVRNSGTSGALVTVTVPAPIAVQGRFMISVLDSLGYRARLKTVRITSDLGPYFNRIMDSSLRIQTGYIGWNADFPSDVSFIHDLFACAAFVPGSAASNSDPSGFCNPSIDRQMARATTVQAQDPPAAVELWQKVEHKILAQAPMVPTYNGQIVDFVSKRVGNYKYHPQWGALLDQLWVK
jgi:peptide/nickel transport system substrate-binding protein